LEHLFTVLNKTFTVLNKTEDASDLHGHYLENLSKLTAESWRRKRNVAVVLRDARPVFLGAESHFPTIHCTRRTNVSPSGLFSAPISCYAFA
jgi:hypothetical protein